MTTPAGAQVRLYELVLASGQSASPFVWRIRYALAHKGITFESVPIGFTEIHELFGGRFKTVPIIEHGQTALAESWDIVQYLERGFPGTPPIFSSAAEYAMARLVDTWFTAEILRKLFRLYVLDVYNAARPEDRPYFRQSRESRLKDISLEAFTADRAAHVPAAREALAPLRTQLALFPFLGGHAPNYADYIALGVFIWVASVNTMPLLARDDQVLRGWLERGFDLYGGMTRDARLRPLFE